ncbi:MAG: hypothetical protein ABT22_12275 [Thiobacillus sp. SCN 64-317]|nr:MAG: hypothetical protein ABT22_12275 [Thiobacillus sp. SCN 64-317]
MRAAVLALTLLAGTAQAAWQWSEPLTVNSVRGAKIYPHVESANRANVAVSGTTVGVVWEDNRSGSPQCYLAMKPATATGFQPEIQLGQAECYEPAVVALEGGRFVAAWEEAGKVHARLLPGGTALTLSTAEAGQATLAAKGDTLYAAWAEQAGRFRRIVVARLDVTTGALRAEPAQPVEAALPTDDQAWPALAVAGDGSVTVAWEDRRDRHTVPMTSHSGDNLKFSAPARLSDVPKGAGLGQSMGLGAGMGAMRPTLAAWGAQGVVAVWLDKRDFLSGYDVYAAFDPGTRRFGPNIRVQDDFGDNIAQWHAKVVGNADGRLLALWDDTRDGTPDVWLADWNGTAFGENVAVPGAAGPGAQSDPSAALDAAGGLHAIWLEQDEQAGARVRYAHATWR